MARPKSDPLLSALIARLPPGGSEWSVEKQIGWLKLMAMAFETIYGGNAAELLKGEISGEAAPKRAALPPPKPVVKYPFIIDKNNYARNGKTDARVMPSQVTDTVFDLRGEDGDLRAIVWADDSTGLVGDVMVQAA